MRKIGLVVSAVLTVAAMALSASAQAQVTVGQVAPSLEAGVLCSEGLPFDEVQTSVAAGASYVVPAAGVLTSWSTNARAAAGQFLAFKVYRPAGPGSYLVVAADGPRSLSPGVVNTFPVNIPVQPGDVIGLFVPAATALTATDCWFRTAIPADRVGWREGNASIGGALTLEGEEGEVRLNVSASLLPPPVVSGISPAEGSIAGGTSVTVTGANFGSVTGVSFGATPATSFAAGSEGQITAVAPASKTVTKVPITVTTVAGTAASPQTFAYEGCVVPKLKGKSLRAAKKRAKKADCGIGKVKLTKEATAKSGEVVKQKPKPGKVLVPGTKVNVTLG